MTAPIQVSFDVDKVDFVDNAREVSCPVKRYKKAVPTREDVTHSRYLPEARSRTLPSLSSLRTSCPSLGQRRIMKLLLHQQQQQLILSLLRTPCCSTRFAHSVLVWRLNPSIRRKQRLYQAICPRLKGTKNLLLH